MTTLRLNPGCLKNGERLGLLLVEPPAGELLPVIDAAWSRGKTGFGALVTQSLSGALLDQTRDVYLFGELDGRIVTRMGYISPADTRDVGTYGFVFTHPDHRRKGVASALLGALLREFENKGGWALHLATGNAAARDLYRQQGFEELGTPRIMRYVSRRFRADDFERDYYAFHGPATVRDAHWGDYPRLEALYSVMDHPWILRDYPRGIWRGDRKNAYEDEGLQLMAQQAERKGATVVLENEARRVVGAGSLRLNPLYSGRVSAEFDLMAMPPYFFALPELIEALVRKAETLGVEWMECWVCQDDCEKHAALRAAGFVLSGSRTDRRLSRQCDVPLELYGSMIGA